MDRPIILKKEQEVQELTEKLKKAKTAINFQYQGLSVDKLTKLRIELRKSNSDVKVYKNNIAKRAAVEAGYENFSNTFVGPQALIISEEDVVAPAKVIHEYLKANKDLNIQITAGIVEGKEVGIKQILELATLPSYETLLTMLAGSMLAPLKDLAVGLNMIIEKE